MLAGVGPFAIAILVFTIGWPRAQYDDLRSSIFSPSHRAKTLFGRKMKDLSNSIISTTLVSLQL